MKITTLTLGLCILHGTALFAGEIVREFNFTNSGNKGAIQLDLATAYNPTQDYGFELEMENQEKDHADNTHFNPSVAYEIAKMIVNSLM